MQWQEVVGIHIAFAVYIYIYIYHYLPSLWVPISSSNIFFICSCAVILLGRGRLKAETFLPYKMARCMQSRTQSTLGLNSFRSTGIPVNRRYALGPLHYGVMN